MKMQPPPSPLLNQEGERVKELESPLLDKEGVGGGCFGANIHNNPSLKTRRKELRNNATPSEKILWRELQKSQLNGYKFRRQHSAGYYILDFYCPSERLAIELDGDSHFTDDAIAYDKERTHYLNTLNIRVIRFLNTDVFENVYSVCQRILDELKA